MDEHQIFRKHQQPIQSIGEAVANHHIESGERTLTPPTLQLKCAACGEDNRMQRKAIQRQPMEEEEELMMKKNPMQRQEEEEELMMKKNPMQRQEEEEEEMQMKRSAIQRKKTADIMQRSTGSGNVIPEEVRGNLEQTLGSDLSDVRVHANSPKAPEVGALAYTQGNDIHFAPGQYNPNSSSGQELLGHEAAHVVQQREGRVQPTGEVNGMPLNDDDTLEREADQLGRQAAQQKKKD